MWRRAAFSNIMSLYRGSAFCCGTRLILACHSMVRFSCLLAHMLSARATLPRTDVCTRYYSIQAYARSLMATCIAATNRVNGDVCVYNVSAYSCLVMNKRSAYLDIINVLRTSLTRLGTRISANIKRRDNFRGKHAAHARHSCSVVAYVTTTSGDEKQLLYSVKTNSLSFVNAPVVIIDRAARCRSDSGDAATCKQCRQISFAPQPVGLASLLRCRSMRLCNAVLWQCLCLCHSYGAPHLSSLIHHLMRDSADTCILSIMLCLHHAKMYMKKGRRRR